MNRVVAIAVCGLALAGCSSTSSWLPELPKGGGAATTLQFESEPAGAEARTSQGQTCRTPCAMAVTATEFTVTFSQPGFQPQTVPVKLSPTEPPDPNSGEPPAPRLVPNPVYVELQPAAAPPAAPRRRSGTAARTSAAPSGTPKPAAAPRTSAAPRAAAPKPAAAPRAAAPAAPPPMPAAPAPAPASPWPPAPPPR